jgi:hypothetical protein
MRFNRIKKDKNKTEEIKETQINLESKDCPLPAANIIYTNQNNNHSIRK